MSIMKLADQWIADRSPQAHALWAKSGDEEAYLRLPQHLIDAACVAEWLWENWTSTALKTTLSKAWGLNKEHIRRLYVFLVGVHDVGKATVSFQRQLESSQGKDYLTAEVSAAGLSLDWPLGEGIEKFPHGTASAMILKKWLRDWGMDKLRAGRIASVVDAHHGFVTDPKLSQIHENTITNYPVEWGNIHREIIDSMAELVDIEDVLDSILDVSGPYADAVQLMTGLVIMSDWMASNQEMFPYVKTGPQSDRVSAAVTRFQLPRPWQPEPVMEDIDQQFQKSFGWSDHFSVRPVQAGAVEAARAQEGPCLMIIEAPTGEGKTEAGLAAAHIIGERSGAQGVFFAAPTMATANGLFERTTEWVRRSSLGGEVVSMYLAHSKNQLSDQYQSLRFAGIGEDTAEHEGDKEPAKRGIAVANQWLSGRYKGILADFVVGTIDQVLMISLQARFSMLRHIGFAGKIVIIDEVHAYDAYMSQYLYRTLQWLANYGVSVILMSATLPSEQRKALAAAYGSQLLEEPQLELLENNAYPLISTVNASGLEVRPLEARSTDLTATVEVLDDSLDYLVKKLVGMLADGGIALIICNTISRSQRAFEVLDALFPSEVDLHHSAFVAAHRSVKEDQLREELGPRSRRGEGRPWRKIVVATQVAEQSLDIDADLLVTDIAPIDLVIQRIGRLHRHKRPSTDRPAQLREPKIFIRGIEKTSPAPEFDSGAEAVYGKKLLLATMANLPVQFKRPDDVAELVQKVYGPNPEIPEPWTEEWETACKKALESRYSAEVRAQTYRFPDPSTSDLHDLFARTHSTSPSALSEEEQGNAQVRDAELTVEVIAIEKGEYDYWPLGSGTAIQNGTEPTYKDCLALVAHTLRLPPRMTRKSSNFDEVIGDLEKQTPGEWATSGLLKGQVALAFDESGIAKAGRYKLRYDDLLGLQIDQVVD
ncbi:CRISPR-associated helicase Cas3' [Corynebacterium hindlerae]|uniref:CRISPR-associated helicase Cas3' n=1 Tax=Corynebacterium hindlerae TaxID=699041 RepID=UPI001AD61094|nr:CRISPR-associated helicase Cas3' [Corynebacterium hindlerae]QTH59639.1 CRISPR-associated helicase Cas3' [Corynebacterium hindlerae]